MEKKLRQDNKDINFRVACFAALVVIVIAVLFVLFSVRDAKLHNSNMQEGQENSLQIQGNDHIFGNEKFCIAKTNSEICSLPVSRYQDLKEDSGGKKRRTFTVFSVAGLLLSVAVHRLSLANMRLVQQRSIMEQWERMKTVRLQI